MTWKPSYNEIEQLMDDIGYAKDNVQEAQLAFDDINEDDEDYERKNNIAEVTLEEAEEVLKELVDQLEEWGYEMP